MTIDLVAGRRRDGSEVLEEVLVDRLADGAYRIAASPGLVLGVAAGDVVRVVSPGRFEVVSRAGNLCIQVFTGEADRVERAGANAIAALGGWLDGKSEHQVVYSIPATAGFPRVEATMNEIVGACPPATWVYGNVYDDQGKPLGWWKRA